VIPWAVFISPILSAFSASVATDCAAAPEAAANDINKTAVNMMTLKNASRERTREQGQVNIMLLRVKHCAEETHVKARVK